MHRQIRRCRACGAGMSPDAAGSDSCPASAGRRGYGVSGYGPAPRQASTDSGKRRRRGCRESPARTALHVAAPGWSCSCGTPPCAERVHQRAPHDFVHERLLAEAHFRLRRVHVDVERVGRHLDEQVHLRAALLDRRHAVGVDDRVRDRPVLDDAAVDEDVLRAARRPLLGQRRDVAGQPDAARLLARPRSGRCARRTAGRGDRAATPPADTAAPCAPALVSVKPISG